MKTFCKNQENLCTFETKFLNRQKKKKKWKDRRKERPENRENDRWGLESDRRIYVREFCVKLKYLVEFSK